jgi:hypothetical protein
MGSVLIIQHALLLVLNPHNPYFLLTASISRTEEVQEMKRGWNKKGDSNFSTGCPIAALFTHGPDQVLLNPDYWGRRFIDISIISTPGVSSDTKKCKKQPA